MSKICFSPEIAVAREDYHKTIQRIKKEKAEALRVWSDLSIIEIDRATNKAEAIAAFRSAPWGSPAKEYAMKKWGSFCEKIEEIKEIVSVCHCRLDVDYLCEKWDALSYIEIEKASSFDEAENAYLNLRTYYASWGFRSSEKSPQIEALEKWLQLCFTSEDLRILDSVVDIHHRNHRISDLFFKRKKELSV